MNKREYQQQRIDAEIAYQLQKAGLQSQYWDELGRPELLPPMPKAPDHEPMNWHTLKLVPQDKPKPIKSDRIGDFETDWSTRWWPAFAAVMTVFGVLLALIFTNLSGLIGFLHWLYGNDLAAITTYVGLIIVGIAIFYYLLFGRMPND